MDACTCEKCISACRTDPGRLLPEDVAKIAAFLNLSEAELIETYLVKRPVMHGTRRVVMLSPAKRKGKRFICEPGREAQEYYEDEKGICVFLDDSGSCMVHPVKPYECAAYMGCKHTFLGRPYRVHQVESFFLTKWRRVK